MKQAPMIAVALICSCVLWTAHAEDQFFESDGVKIRYIVQGEGEPLVLIHGYTASIEQNWGSPGILDALTEDYQVIALDCRGHGKSDKPHDPEAYGAQMSKDVKNLLDHLSIEKAHIAGYSMGGMITLHFLNTYPERCLSAIVAGFGWTDPDANEPDISNELAEALENGEGLRPLIEGLTPEGRPMPSEDQIQSMSNMILASNDPKALAACARGFPDLNVTEEQLTGNKVPTLGVVGEIDPLKSRTDAMAEHMPHVTEVIVPGADHMTAVGHPKLLEAMRQFLKSQSEGSGSKSKKAA